MSTAPVNDDEFLQQFEQGTLPRDAWTHRAHLKVAYLMLQSWPLAAAIDRLRVQIKAYNLAVGNQNTATLGYHETLTQVWMHLVHNAMLRSGRCDSADAFLAGAAELLDPQLLDRHYTRERLLSPLARAEFVAPDRAPLPSHSP